MVLTGTRTGNGGTTVVTQVPRRGGPPRPPFEPRPRGRALWPWLLALGALLAALVGGYFLYEAVQRQLEEAKPVAVPYVVGIERALAVEAIRERGLEPQVRNLPNSDVEEGLVFAQVPTEGTRVEKETVVRIDVSSGKPEVSVPSVVGQTLANAVEELTAAGLDAQVVEVNSDREAGTVTGQAPGPGTVVVEGTQVRINVSQGPKPVTVPNVIGLAYEQAASELQRSGFGVARVDVDSDLARGVVVEQDPDGGSSGSKGSTVTLSVSRGPTTSSVPDVTNQDVTIAEQTLKAAGFRPRTVLEDTDDRSLDGIVISQDPIGGTQRNPKSVVTLFVGRFTVVTEPTDTTPTTPATTTTTQPTQP
jgi:eukaryotic-like serine/threonine-protein kinase